MQKGSHMGQTVLGLILLCLFACRNNLDFTAVFWHNLSALTVSDETKPCEPGGGLVNGPWSTFFLRSGKVRSRAGTQRLASLCHTPPKHIILSWCLTQRRRRLPFITARDQFAFISSLSDCLGLASQKDTEQGPKQTSASSSCYCRPR